MKNVKEALSVWMAGASLVLLAFATYWNSLAVPFFFDDPAAILENPTIRDPGNLVAVLSPPRDGSGVTGRPLVNLSLALNFALSGESVAGYHVANIAFHAAAGLLLFGCIRRTVARARILERFRRQALLIGFSTAALWLVHPLQTESVVCVIQRTELLVGLFYLLTLYCFIRAVERPSAAWSAVTVASCFLGMMSKEVMVSAPIIIFLYDRTFVAGSFGDAWRARRGLHLGIASAWLLLALLVISIGGTRGQVAGFGVGATWWSYALKQCEAIILYLRLTIWPHPLVVFYGVDVVTNVADVWRQILMLFGLVGGSIYAVWKKPALGFCAMWFFAILAPSSSVMPLPSQTVSEHRMYLSLAAPLVMAVAGLLACGSRHIIPLVLCGTFAGAALSCRRNLDYRHELAIWTDTVAKAPGNARARVNLGHALAAAGNPTQALAEYHAALQRDPNSPDAMSNLASLLTDLGRPAEAIELCRLALRMRPDFAQAHNNLGAALLKTRRIAESIGHFEAALGFKPTLAEAHCNLSSALVQLGRPDEAIVHAEHAARLHSNYALAYFNLSNAYLLKNQRDQAALALQTAIKSNPAFAEAHSSLGSIYFEAGDAARAIAHYETALRAKPDFLDAHFNLAIALVQVGRHPEAIEQYRIIIQLQPENAEAYFNLGYILSRIGRNTEALAAYREALRLRPDHEPAKSEIARLHPLQSRESPR